MTMKMVQPSDLTDLSGVTSTRSGVGEVVLSLRDVQLTRGPHFQLAVNSLELAQGRAYLLQGPNGSGKSSLLSLLALLDLPEKGQILFAGKAVSTAAARAKCRRQVTLVGQTPYLFSGTVYDNLAFGLRLRNLRGDLQSHRISRALQSVGLEGFDQRTARELSGGEIQRVALARALVLQPKVLLLDEPAASLDCDALPLLKSIIADQIERGTTVVLSSHQPLQLGPQAAEELCLSAGKLVSAASGDVHCQSV